MKIIFKNMKKTTLILNISLVLILYSCSDSKKADENQMKADSLSYKTNIKSEDIKSETKLLGDLYIVIPDELEEASEDKIKLKYPGAKRPDFVFGTENMQVNLCYSITKTPLKLSELNKYLETTSAGIMQQIGKESVSQSYMDTINTVPFAVIEFYSPTADEGRIYNLMFATSLNDKMVLISFNCLESLLPEWEQDVSEIFSSLKLEK